MPTKSKSRKRTKIDNLIKLIGTIILSYQLLYFYVIFNKNYEAKERTATIPFKNAINAMRINNKIANNARIVGRPAKTK